jgi:uncharacterized protein
VVEASREFQVFVKPAGAVCNLDCEYCYYLATENVHRKGETFPMADDLLEAYIVQHIEASPAPEINFSWHGGEPTVLGVDYFRRIVELERKHQPPDRHITNGIQTNGTLLDENWCRFLSAEGFTVGLSLDGPQDLHDRYRVTKGGKPTHERAMRGYDLLRQYRIPCDILCVVNAYNVRHPSRVYRFFKMIKAPYIGFLPLVEPQPELESGVSHRSVPAVAWGDFLSSVYDEWLSQDVGRVKVQIFEEAAKTALGEEHRLCLFRKTCGDIPVVEQNGDFYPCDHFVDSEYPLGNIGETPLVELLESPEQIAFGRAKADTLPAYCRTCDVLAMCHGECPKNRIIQTPDGEAGLNYLCEGYKGFFSHCKAFLSDLALLRRRQPIEHVVREVPSAEIPTGSKTGRNDPCPCGSGRKYKRCCLGKTS